MSHLRASSDSGCRVQSSYFKNIQRDCKIGGIYHRSQPIEVIPLPGQENISIDHVVSGFDSLPVLIWMTHVVCEKVALYEAQKHEGCLYFRLVKVSEMPERN